MAYPDAVVSRLGQRNLANDPRDLNLELFGGEVFHAFDRRKVTKGRHKVKTIKGGKSAKFPMTWKVGSYDHVPGTELAFEQMEHADVTIEIDSLTVAPVFLDILDEAMNHYETRGEYAHQCGEELANKYDSNVFRVMHQASLNASALASGYPGLVIGHDTTGGLLSSDAATLVDAIFLSQQLFDERDTPEEGRQMFIRPAQWYLLFRNAGATGMTIFNRDFGGGGSVETATMPKIGNMELVKTNNMPDADETGDGAVLDKYEEDCSDLVALINTPECAGTCEMIGLKAESAYDIRRQGHITLAKYAAGHGHLRTEVGMSLTDAIVSPGTGIAPL